MTLQRTDLFGIMRPDLDRVNQRLIDAAQVNHPAASSLVTDIVSAGGKRLRPLLLLLAARSFDFAGSHDRLITAAAGVELLHTASLIHDDTVDRAAMRRGRPTLNSVLSTGATILIGDYLFAQSAILATATGNIRVVTIFASTLGAICDGQLREVFQAHRLDQTREEYDARAYGKTASLFAGAAEMGAVLAGATEDQIQSLRGFGADVGMAFQIVDDLLDVIGDTARLGKPAGNDLREGTVTLPILFYAASLDGDAAALERLRCVVSGQTDGDAALAELLGAIRSSPAVNETLAAARSLVARAKERVATLPDVETRELLSELAELSLNRDA